MYSPYQPSLHPNQYIVLKVAFDEVENNSSTVLVRLNQNGAVLESNYTNNSAQIVLSSSHSYNNSLYLTCTVTDTSIERGEYVTYYANVSGGKSPYSYRWSGDFTGYYRAMRVKYNDDGRQEVEVKVSDRNGNTITKECPDVYVDEDSYNNDDADLVINDFEFGYINSSGYFVEDYSIDEDDNAAVRIQIENDGEDFNDKWRFEIKENGYVLYRSPYYAGLDEGDKFDLELALTRIYEGDYELTLEVDSSDNVDESNENNNRKSIDISIRD